MMIVETDLGHDPDDLFAICWLGTFRRISAVCVVPGAPDQIRLAQMIRRLSGYDFPIGAAKMSPKKEPATGVHRHVLDRYASGDGVPDGDSVSVAVDLVTTTASSRSPPNPSSSLTSSRSNDCRAASTSCIVCDDTRK